MKSPFTASRRMFLRGAGATIALPLLESLMPRRAWAQARPKVRYIQLFSPFGPSERVFWGQRNATLTAHAPNVRYQRLSAISGAISPMFGTEFQSFKNKMSLVRGLDVLARNVNHNFCMTTCASSYREGMDGDHLPPFSGQPSIDALLSASGKVYGSDVPTSRRLVMLNPLTTDQYTRTRSATFLPTSTGDVAMAVPLKQTSAFLESFSSAFGGSATAGVNESRLMSSVWDDYKRVRDSSRISGADRQRLETYMALITDISTGSAACAMPDQDPETQEEIKLDNQFRLLAAAMSCGLTRVASILLGITGPYLDMHQQHHFFLSIEAGNRASTLRDGFARNGQRIARLLGILDAVDDGDGTLLDNSIVYYSQQYGTQIPRLTTASQHLAADMPVMIAGGGGGALNQGRYLDLRAPTVNDANGAAQQRLGVPLNNLLVTIMNAMGLSSSDYELAGRAGYGDYPSTVTPNRRADGDFWLGTEGKRSPLPLLYSGPARG